MKTKVPASVFFAVILVLIGGLVGVYIADLPPSMNGFRGGSSRCSYYLAQLYKGLHLYKAQFGNNLHYPPHRGEAVWLCLIGQCGDTQQHPPEYFKNAPFHGMNELLVCPDSKNHFRPTDYRGPSQILSDDRHDKDPIGADKPGNHRGAGGNVLRFDGSVGFRVEEEYEAALKQLE